MPGKTKFGFPISKQIEVFFWGMFFRESFRMQSYDKTALSTGFREASDKKAGFMEKVFGRKYFAPDLRAGIGIIP